MNWVLSVLVGLALAVLTLYLIKKRQVPVPITETYVQQPVHKGADISEQDSMLVAVGLQSLYTPRPSVMDTSQISKEAWLASQAAALASGAPSPGGRIVTAQQAEQAPMGVSAAGSPMWSAGAVAGQTAGQAQAQPQVQQVFLPGGTALEQLQVPAPAASMAAPPRGPTPEDQAAAMAKAEARFTENQALQGESASAKAERDRIAALKAAAAGQYKDTWLPSQSDTNDTAANRTTFVGSLVAKLSQDKLNFNNYFESEWKQTNGPYAGDAAKTAAFRSAQMTAQKILQDSQSTIDALDSTWQNSNAVDCYPMPWTTFATETTCSKPCGPGKKTQTRKYQEPLNGGQACPPPSARETRDVDCNLRACTYSTSPSSATCAPNWTFRPADNRCTNVSPVNPAEGCAPSWTYDAATGYCKKTGYTSTRPTPPPGYVFNATTMKFEQTADPTFGCTTAGFNLYTGILGFTYPPICTGYV
jgi:hypothetical protein